MTIRSTWGVDDAALVSVGLVEAVRADEGACFDRRGGRIVRVLAAVERVKRDRVLRLLVRL